MDLNWLPSRATVLKPLFMCNEFLAASCELYLANKIFPASVVSIRGLSVCRPANGFPFNRDETRISERVQLKAHIA